MGHCEIHAFILETFGSIYRLNPLLPRVLIYISISEFRFSNNEGSSKNFHILVGRRLEFVKGYLLIINEKDNSCNKGLKIRKQINLFNPLLHSVQNNFHNYG